MTNAAPNFDKIARPYRLLEYLSMGRSLEKTRFAFLPKLCKASNALVLGDGDGRFTQKLLEANNEVRVTAVDTSSQMLSLLRARCVSAGDRLETVQADALAFCRDDLQSYDLIVTHFFLDCLSQSAVDELSTLLAAKTAPGATWVVSEFAIPNGMLRLPGKILVKGLYKVFRVITGLQVSQLPNHTRALNNAGFIQTKRKTRLGGILRSELWSRQV